MKAHLRTTLWTLFRRNAGQREIERLTGISRHTIRAYRKLYLADPANCPGVATDDPAQIDPPWPPTLVSASVSKCEPHREFIEAQLKLKRNAVSVYQDLVDGYGFTGAYNSVKRFVANLKIREPEQFTRLSFLPAKRGDAVGLWRRGTHLGARHRPHFAKPRLFVATLRYSRRSCKARVSADWPCPYVCRPSSRRTHGCNREIACRPKGEKRMSLKQRLDRAIITNEKTRCHDLAVKMPGDNEEDAIAKTGLTPKHYKILGFQ